ncbi:hypothetical protein [Streptomyces meridianus]|uniref:CRISPR type III-B/RAMP module-associated protein Cmr5 n=1 Tax=Streptomyces meridianus TaxID=2938945 RepID=A0ABT0XCC6_9ACTN|nr:hypothetical protein [Streptomyces meridianus]MCM2580179.1 hypothetical protein [Streptomyces meridianus]
MAELRDEKDRNRDYRAGQLHAAVAALQNMAGVGSGRMMSPGFVSLAATSPGRNVRGALFEVGQYLVKAAEHSNGRGQAADEIFATLPKLLRGCGGLVDGLGAQGQEEFKEGCRDQFEVYREKYGSVVG